MASGLFSSKAVPLTPPVSPWPSVHPDENAQIGEHLPLVPRNSSGTLCYRGSRLHFGSKHWATHRADANAPDSLWNPVLSPSDSITWGLEQWHFARNPWPRAAGGLGCPHSQHGSGDWWMKSGFWSVILRKEAAVALQPQTLLLLGPLQSLFWIQSAGRHPAWMQPWGKTELWKVCTHHRQPASPP